MANVDYYKKVNENYQPTEIIEIYENGGGASYNLKTLEARILTSGEVLDGLYIITEDSYNALKDEFMKFLALDLIKQDESGVLLNSEYKEEFEDLLCDRQEKKSNKDKTFNPKTSFSLMHVDLQVPGFTEKTTMELVDFILEAKANHEPILITDMNGKIVSLVDSKTVSEASFEFQEL
tara:strand:+ start:305 stop:838 length:534 start_codon:yes stop_codon:yes gene_type:complete